MKLHQPGASIFVPDERALDEAFGRVTHLGIGAHQDDLEVMAYHGIATCTGDSDHWFGGVTCTDGSASPRTGPFAGYSNEEMQTIRRAEQERAADLGGYSVMAQLDYPSSAVKGPERPRLEADLVALLEAMTPEVVYTHNPADKHETHVAVCVAVINAIRQLPVEARPKHVYGCETWRDLDWLLDDDVVVLDVSARPELAELLIAVFESQIAGGKRYDVATIGRRRSNATFRESHAVDEVEQAWLAMDLSPLARDDSIELRAYVDDMLERFVGDVQARLDRHSGSDG